MQDFFSQLIHIAQIQWVQQAFWTVVLALATLATSRIVARAMRHILDRDSNPLPSSSIIINIVRATILTLGASIILDVIYNINANAIIHPGCWRYRDLAGFSRHAFQPYRRPAGNVYGNCQAGGQH